LPEKCAKQHGKYTGSESPARNVATTSANYAPVKGEPEIIPGQKSARGDRH
jgi:hypothetical protein